ncbi:MAG: hypothetical protein ACOC32_03460 [Nanoarchaeota archaeon]
MLWSIEKDYYIDIISTKRDGSVYKTIEPYKGGDDLSFFDTLICSDDRKIELYPYSVEHFSRPYQDRNSIIRDLQSGIRDEELVAYLGFRLKGNRVMRYFFENDWPSGFMSPSIRSPSWPLNRAPIEMTLLSGFAEIKEHSPKAAESLDQCIAHLAKPGPRYGKENNGVIFNLRNQ